MKKFFKFAAMAAIAAMFAGCQDKPDPEPGPDTPDAGYTQDLEFTLELKEVEADQAKVIVEHNGTDTDTWYGFATTETDIEKAITDALAEGNIKLQKRTKYTMTVKDLEPETDYTFVAVGVTAEGETYGEAATLEFTTKAAQGAAGLKENSAWTVEYSGSKELEGNTYEHTVTVNSTDENAYFVSTAWSKEEFEAIVAEYGLEAIIQYEIDELKDYIAMYNDYYGIESSITDWLYVGTEWDIVDITPGDWYVMAIGVGADGEASGLYAISDVISIAEEEATEAYSAWIGNWTLTGANGVSCDVTFEKKFNNLSYNMLGYQGMGEQTPVEVTWMKDQNIWAIYPQEYGTWVIDEDGTEGDIYFLGAQAAEEQGYTLWTDVPVCVGGDTEEGKLIMGYYDEENGIDMTLMSYFVIIENQPYFWSEINLLPTFPITVTPAAEAATTAMSVKENSNRRQFVTKLGKRFMPAQNYGTYGTNLMLF